MTPEIIESLKGQLIQRVELLKNHPAMGELLKLHAALNHLEDVEGVPRTALAQFFGLDDIGQSVSAPAPTLVQPGQYFDSAPLDAAKDYLARRGKSATLDEIIAALKTGSCDPGNREKFGLSLARSTFNFVKLGGDLYDLLDRYPNVKAQRSGGTKRKSTAARTEEIMSEGPISISKAVAKAEAEEENSDNQ